MNNLSEITLFEDAIKSANRGYKHSDTVLDTVLIIKQFKDGGYFAELNGVKNQNGNRLFNPAFSLDHDWVLDEQTIRPLPEDINGLIKKEFHQFSLESLSFKDVVALSRIKKDWIEIIVDEEVWNSGKLCSENSDEIPPVDDLNATLFNYQARGVQWMHQVIVRTGGLILADEMGLGKTIQIIALLLLERPQSESPALIVCPTSLLANWRKEIFSFAPKLSVLIHRGADRAGLAKYLKSSDIVLTTYDTAVLDIHLLRSIDWTWVICDEAQAIKNPDSQRRQALGMLSRKYTLPVTGTPFETSLRDIWSLSDFAIPGLLGSESVFAEQFPDSEESAIEVNKLIAPIMLRRMVVDVASELPERFDIDLPIELPDTLASEYESIRRQALDEYESSGALVASTRLQLFTAHPLLQEYPGDDDFWQQDNDLSSLNLNTLMTPKMEVAVSLLKEAFINKKKVLVFANYNRCGRLLHKAVSPSTDVFWDVINGGTPQEERQRIVDAFSNWEGAGILVLNPKAAGTGLNITAATVVIHFTQVWNPAIEMQASARAYRRGQLDPVTIYRLYYESTVEEIMIERSQWRRQLANQAIPLSARDTSDMDMLLKISPLKNEN